MQLNLYSPVVILFSILALGACSEPDKKTTSTPAGGSTGAAMPGGSDGGGDTSKPAPTPTPTNPDPDPHGHRWRRGHHDSGRYRLRDPLQQCMR